MSRNLPPLNPLQTFEAAGRYQSFSRAAKELWVSHSSISRHVRGLEDRSGVQLFRDHARGVKLSPDGAAYLARISPALDTIAEATEGLAKAPAGTVTINSEPLFAKNGRFRITAGLSIAARQNQRHMADMVCAGGRCAG